eukprot:TRINITY_DN587_c0_g1_i1.p1 TRINITY_DN587_c0_g1~~TRINITY_DN587_c0_g1_i1.p1  ORF type:complete len:109 (+),score=11.89 TRINITY_DN587_c0_g1_i1:125-451(+)
MSRVITIVSSKTKTYVRLVNLTTMTEKFNADIGTGITELPTINLDEVGSAGYGLIINTCDADTHSHSFLIKSDPVLSISYDTDNGVFYKEQEGDILQYFGQSYFVRIV